MAGFVDKIKRMQDSPDDEYEYDDYSYEDNNKDSYDDEDPYEEQREHQREVRRSERSERRRYTSDSYTDSDSGNKVVNINASTKIQVILFKPERFGDEQEVLQMKSTRIALQYLILKTLIRICQEELLTF